jgi:hypothetical protein
MRMLVGESWVPLRTMRIRISNDELLPDLLDYLSLPIDTVVGQVGLDQLEANILGYGRDGAQLELDLRLRIWESGHPNVTVERVSGGAGAETPPDDI